MTKQKFPATFQEKFRAWAAGKPKIQENHAITLLQAADYLDQLERGAVEPAARQPLEWDGVLTFSCTVCGMKDAPTPCQHVRIAS